MVNQHTRTTQYKPKQPRIKQQAELMTQKNVSNVSIQLSLQWVSGCVVTNLLSPRTGNT